MLTIKWMGLPYSEHTCEKVYDLINAGIEYLGPLQALMEREDAPPKRFG
jgi:hypothetical protein